MTTETSELRSRIAALLHAQQQLGALLAGMEGVAGEDGFRDCADLWAPALYYRNALYFTPFLLRNLDKDQEKVIRDLLPRSEADGNDALFAGLYAKVTTEDDWNADILALAQSGATDDQVAHALELRAVPQQYYTLKEPVAATLYRRNPARFREFVRDHVRPGEIWEEKRRRSYQDLRAAAQAAGDDDFFWWLFRTFADAAAWQAEMRRLAQGDAPAGNIAEELQKRQVANVSNLDTSSLIAVVERYGTATFPYIDANVDWIGGKTALRLLPLVERTDDIALTRHIFFQFGSQDTWQEEARKSIMSSASDDEVLRGLQRWMPPDPRWTHRFWWLKNDTALALYRRNPALFRPFLLRTVHDPDAALFAAAEQVRDEEFLDFLTAAFLDQLSTAITYKAASQKVIPQTKLNRKTKELLGNIGPLVLARFARLAAESPATYVEHAAHILSRGLGLAYFLGPDVMHNPMTYLKDQHHAAWRQSATAMREVLETPSPNVVGLGLHFLSDGDGGTNTAQRVVENVLVLQAQLLGPAPRDTKKAALLCLQSAAAQGSPYAERVLPVLSEAMHYHSKDAVPERVMIAFVRARRAATTRQTA